MTMAEHKECDERNRQSWDRGFTFGLWVGALAGAAVGLIVGLVVRVFCPDLLK
jgi:hypothetical protein